MSGIHLKACCSPKQQLWMKIYMSESYPEGANASFIKCQSAERLTGDWQTVTAYSVSYTHLDVYKRQYML